MSIPAAFDINERIRERALDPNDLHYEREEFRVNIPTLIKLYKEGKMRDPNEKPTYLRDGKIMSREESLAYPIGAWEEYEYARFDQPTDSTGKLRNLLAI
ncbi:hypothetical protein EMCG_06393 [[Emmonsia] crescens]|uniref:Uncharacterized protein n=1 Tax=[Emmonsia] crescens TaxID=73230 RepID=A0A0G2J6R6_9EURO|nr:hypothetical protein EMCG_06393 [Emmonsia crescens UAMH 3008]